MLTVAVVAISLDRDEGRPGATTFVGRHVVNTPSELSAGIVGGASRRRRRHARRTRRVSSERAGSAVTARTAARHVGHADQLSGGIRHKFAGDALGTNTPSELSGGIGDGLPAEIYDRHQRG